MGALRDEDVKYHVEPMTFTVREEVRIAERFRERFQDKLDEIFMDISISEPGCNYDDFVEQYVNSIREIRDALNGINNLLDPKNWEE